jgi:hypothetical protein
VSTTDPSSRDASSGGRTAPRPGRRAVLAGGVGAALGAAAVGTAWGVSATDNGGSGGGEAQGGGAPAEPQAPAPRRFVSTQLVAPEATLTGDAAAASAGLVFTTPRMPAFRGVAWDNAGTPVWIEPDGYETLDLRVQEYDGRPVLTYWTGQVLEGTGNGKGVLLDEQYHTVAEVRLGNGVLGDFHEFILTPRGTAYLMSYPTYPWDLSVVDGPAEGYVWGARIQEVDVATGEVLFDWEGLDHIDVEESHRALDDTGKQPALPWDPIHLNSIAEDGEDFLLLSARHTSALYKVDKRTGEIVWRFGGERSDIEVPEGGDFAWQHDLRRQPDGTLTIYDNHDNATERGDAVSAALRFEVDEDAMTAELVQALRHEDRYGYAMGNAHYLDDGHVLVGWGMDPFATEFDADGEVVWELGGLGLGSYRSWRMPWTGRPTTDPDLAVRDGSAYMSWNGATELRRWRVLTGTSPEDLAEAVTVEREDFEMAAQLDGRVTHVQVEALDESGAVLGTSRVVSVSDRVVPPRA